MATPGLAPSSRMRATVLWRWRQASWCTVILSDPAFTKCFYVFVCINDHQMGVEWELRHLSDGGNDHRPEGDIRTKRPSMISKWIQSAPPSSARETCSPRIEKSAARTDGAMYNLVMARSECRWFSHPFEPPQNRLLAPSAPIVPLWELINDRVWQQFSVHLIRNVADSKTGENHDLFRLRNVRLVRSGTGTWSPLFPDSQLD